MSVAKILAGMTNHLLELDLAFPTSRENRDFNPDVLTAWQKVDLLPASPDNTTIGQTHYLEVGLMQVTLHYPLNKGAGEALTKAEAIKAHFKRGTTIPHEGLQVIVTRTPSIAPALHDDKWYKVPISIFYQSDVFI